MSARLVALLPLAVLLACRGPAAPPASPSPESSRPPAASAPQATPAEPRLERDLLRYGDGDGPAAPEPEVPALAPAQEVEAPPPAPPPPARLVGFVRRPGQLCAALVLGSGEPDVLCPGEQARGHRLLAADEERGVRLTLPDGRELELPAPR